MLRKTWIKKHAEPRHAPQYVNYSDPIHLMRQSSANERIRSTSGLITDSEIEYMMTRASIRSEWEIQMCGSVPVTQGLYCARHVASDYEG